MCKCHISEVGNVVQCVNYSGDCHMDFRDAQDVTRDVAKSLLSTEQKHIPSKVLYYFFLLKFKMHCAVA